MLVPVVVRTEPAKHFTSE